MYSHHEHGESTLHLMYVLERLEGETARELLAAPDNESVSRLLKMIARSRSRSSDTTEREHLRAAMYRLSTEANSGALLTLDGEHFQIREDADAAPCPKAKKRTLRKIAKGLPPIARIVEQPTSVEEAVKIARAESEPEPGWIPPSTDDVVQIDGERFEI